MELVDGRSLDKAIPADGLAVETAVGYAAQIADALACAHEQGIVHRDLKGANVVITEAGRAKVLDFGIARRMGGEELETVTRSGASLGDTESVAGTLPYMAPEVLRGAPADARSDIWALGVLLQETGGRGGGAEAGRAAASAVVDGRGVRTCGRHHRRIRGTVRHASLLGPEPAL